MWPAERAALIVQFGQLTGIMTAGEDAEIKAMELEASRLPAGATKPKLLSETSGLDHASSVFTYLDSMLDV